MSLRRISRERGLAVVSKRIGWGVADQALSSITNFALSVMVARAVSPAEFGLFGLVFASYIFSLMVSRAVCSEPLLIRFSTVASARFERETAASVGTAPAVGAGAGVVVALLGLGVTLSMPAADWTPFLVLAMLLPGVLVQDAWRLAFLARGTPRSAFVNDMLWALLLVAGFGLLSAVGAVSVVNLIAVWGLSGLTAGIAGIAQAGVRPRPRSAPRWLRAHRDLSVRYSAEYLALTGSPYLVLFALGLVTTLTEVAALRGAQLLVSPLVVLFGGLAISAAPEMSRALARSRDSFDRHWRLLSLGLSATALLWSALLLLLPDRAGEALLGRTWDTTQPLLLAFGVGAVAAALAIGPQTALRALAAASRSLRARLATSALSLTAGVAGGILGGAPGAAAGLAVSASAGTVLWFASLARTERTPPSARPDRRAEDG